MTTSRLTLAALAAFSSICTLAGASAQAQTDTPRSRAEVIVEVHAARAAGTLGAHVGEDSGSFHLAQQPFAASARSDVVAELTQYRASGEMAAQVPELAMWIDTGTSASTRTRAEVRAELAAARAAGVADVLNGEDSGSFHFAHGGHAPAAARMAGAPAGPLATAGQLSQICARPDSAAGASGQRLASAAR